MIIVVDTFEVMVNTYTFLYSIPVWLVITPNKLLAIITIFLFDEAKVTATEYIPLQLSFKHSYPALQLLKNF